MSTLPKTLFVGWNYDSVVSYYRCFLPSIALGADHLVWQTTDKAVVLRGGLRERAPKPDDLYDYEVIVLQQPRGVVWLNIVRELQSRGIRVLYEIDDYVQSARKTKSHELSGNFDEKTVRDMELVMRVCDGVICTNDFLARRYLKFNERTWVCPNGVDFARYRPPRTPRTGVTLGFAGGLGHKASLARWAPALRNVLRARPDARFVSVGYPAAAEYVEAFGAERAVAYPSAKIEVYPATMSLFDVAFAPSAENNLVRGKSDLRWLESSALGIPLVAHPDVYPDIEDGVTGLHARTPAEAEAALLALVDDAELRERIGRQAHATVYEHRRIEVVAEHWRAVIEDVASVPTGSAGAADHPG
jgi:glycosyltransferase involved in cell wall biosynthesis